MIEFLKVLNKQLEKKKRFDSFYMKMALETAAFSYCKRKQVGSVFVKDDVILIGYNGTIAGEDNICEDEKGETKPEVLHSESNVLSKIMTSPINATGGTIYCTLSPCVNCAKLIIQAKIGRFVYLTDHSDQTGINLMIKAGIEVEKFGE